MDLFESGKVVRVCAPMVRYSKLSFRCLVRKYGCDVCFTPMIVAADFMRSVKARDSEFTTDRSDRPLIIQFAAKDAQTLADAACVVAPFSDGVDLNCGCPQRWAMAEGYGACLINKPQLVKDMVRHVKDQVEKPNYAVSIKIRIHKDLRKTVDLCQKVEAAGVSWITVHGRTAEERHQPVHYDAIKTIKDSLSIPVIANGDVKNLQDVESIHQLTGVDGVMAARGLLANPALFAGYEYTPLNRKRGELFPRLSKTGDSCEEGELLDLRIYAYHGFDSQLRPTSITDMFPWCTLSRFGKISFTGGNSERRVLGRECASASTPMGVLWSASENNRGQYAFSLDAKGPKLAQPK
ncbi:hypothetical protein MHYP_G00314960 [Metynnis hypsauchen]